MVVVSLFDMGVGQWLVLQCYFFEVVVVLFMCLLQCCQVQFVDWVDEVWGDVGQWFEYECVFEFGVWNVQVVGFFYDQVVIEYYVDVQGLVVEMGVVVIMFVGVFQCVQLGIQCVQWQVGFDYYCVVEECWIVEVDGCCLVGWGDVDVVEVCVQGFYCGVKMLLWLQVVVQVQECSGYGIQCVWGEFIWCCYGYCIELGCILQDIDMIYCVGIEVNEGLVFVVDICINVLLDDVCVYCKLYEFEFLGEVVLVIMVVGNLVIIQLLILWLCWDVEEQCVENLWVYWYLFEVVEYVGCVLVDSQVNVILQDVGYDGIVIYVILILGGQIVGEYLGLYMIYLLGNVIVVLLEILFLQIGEFKYGKLILDCILCLQICLEDVVCIVIVLLDLIICLNLLVGLLMDLVLICDGDLCISQCMWLVGDLLLYVEIYGSWLYKFEQVVVSLLVFFWEY